MIPLSFGHSLQYTMRFSAQRRLLALRGSPVWFNEGIQKFYIAQYSIEDGGDEPVNGVYPLDNQRERKFHLTPEWKAQANRPDRARTSGFI